MKKIYLLVLLSISLGFAQETNKNNVNVNLIPANYYSSATGTGYALKTQLKKIIDNVNDGLTPEYIAVDRGYGSGTSQTNNGLWTAYGTTDRDYFYDNDGTILDIYSENPTGVDPYNFNYNTTVGANAGQCGTYSVEGDCYNREHIVPQSVFASANPMHNDPHFIPPTDGKVNGQRNNFPHGMVTTPTWTSLNGGKLGPNSNTGISAGYVGTVFEPINEFKGDIARMYLYFATRYESVVAGYAYDMFNNTSNQVFTPTFLNILLTWHNQDPVSPYEIARNNAIYAFQNNRNPYIDHPEYVCLIWSAACALSTNEYSLLPDINVYPNPSNDQKINIETENDLDEIQIINVNGQIIQQVSKPVRNQNKYTLENLPHGFYFLKLSSDNKSIVKKIVIN